MGFIDDLRSTWLTGSDPTDSSIGRLAGAAAQAQVGQGAKSALTATPQARQAFVNRILKGKGGKRQLAYFLKSRGFDMSIAGPQGYKWALHGFVTLGDDAEQIDRYNQAWAKVKHPPAPAAPGRTIPAPTRPTAGSSGGAGTAGAGMSDIGGLVGSAAADIPTATTDYGSLLAGLNTRTARVLDPRSFAKTQAAAFDPQIAELLLAQRRAGPQGQQNLANISSWYGQVGRQQGEGIAATERSNEAAQTRLRDVGSQLVQAAGGNEAAAGLVGAATATGAGTLGAIGESNLALANRLKELTALEGKTKGIDEQRYQAKMAADLALELANTRGKKGAAFADALTKALAFNNEARQTNFANRLSALQTQIGADAAGVNLAAAKLGLASDKVNLAGKILSYQQAVDTYKSGGRVYWKKMTPEARAGLVNAAVNATLGKKGNPVKGAFDSRKGAYAWAVRTAGINHPGFRASVDAELRRRFPQWYANTNK